MRMCSVEDCNNKYQTKGYCNKHWQKMLRYGDPFYTIQNHERHGLRNIPEYIIWAAMKTRCYNKKQRNYHRYGGRGIIVCDRWRNSFSAFFEDMGHKPFSKAQIDRINNGGNYELDNCKWSTSAENSQNGSRTKLTTEIARNIRSIYSIGNVSYGKLSAIYAVSRCTIRDVVKLRTWKEI